MKSDVRRILTNIAANITEYHIISLLTLQRIIIQKFMMIRQVVQVKNHIKMSKIIMFKMNTRIFW